MYQKLIIMGLSLFLLGHCSGEKTDNGETSKKIKKDSIKTSSVSGSLLETIPYVAAKYHEKVKALNLQMKKLEKEAETAFMSQDQKAILKLQNKSRVLEKQREEIRALALEKMKSVISEKGGFITVPFNQDVDKNKIEIKDCVIYGVV